MTRHAAIVASLCAMAALSGCPAPGAPTAAATTGAGSTANSTGSPNPAPSAPTVPVSARAARIIFKQNYPSGSFDASPAGGTPPGAGYGQGAVRVFNADSSLLANCLGGVNCSATPGWPAWLSSVEIGISGSKNTAASNADCARFTATNEVSSCNFGAGAGGNNCNSQGGWLRVSEFDCVSGTPPATGNGGPGDGIYVRANFNRSALLTNENILAVIEYAAASVDPPPSIPSNCFANGVFDPALTAGSTPGNPCADFVWRVYIKHSATEVVQPYLLLVPPFFGGANFAAHTGGAGTTSKQFVIPLAGDPLLQTVQFSRINSGLSPTSVIPGSGGMTFQQVCAANAGVAANSPLCSGLVLYSLTFFRI